MMKCCVCGNETLKFFSAELMKKYQVDYHLCPNCNYLQLQDLSHLQEAYETSINKTDVGLLARNYRFTEQLAPFFYFSGKLNGRFLDYGGGYGVFTRLMRDIGFDFYSNDPYTENIFSQKFSSELQGDFSAITALEVFEHLSNPMDVISLLLEHTDLIAIGTNLLESCIKKDFCNWSYLGLDHGQHIGFFSIHTMEFIAKKFNLHYYSDGKYLTLLSKKKIFPFAALQIKLRHRFSVFFLEYVKFKMKSKISSDYELMK